MLFRAIFCTEQIYSLNSTRKISQNVLVHLFIYEPGIIHERGQTKGRDGNKQGAQDYNICKDLKKKHLTSKDKTGKLSDSTGFEAS